MVFYQCLLVLHACWSVSGQFYFTVFLVFYNYSDGGEWGLDVWGGDMHEVNLSVALNSGGEVTPLSIVYSYNENVL